jgi:YD repeat-containing protein
MADFKDLTNEMKKTNQKVDNLSKAVKDSSTQDKQNTAKLTQGMGEIIKNDVGGGIKELAGTITAPLTSFAKAIPGVSTLGKVVGQLGKNASANAKQVEKDREQARRENKSNTLLEGIVNGVLDLKDSFLKGIQKASGMSLGLVAGMIAAPVITLVNFFKSLGTELRFLNKLTGGRLANLFKPIVKLFDGIGALFKGNAGGLKGLTNIEKAQRTFGRYTKFLRSIIEGPIKLFGKISKAFSKFPVVVQSFTNMFKPIAKFAAGFGKILGKVFLPITIVMALWDTITGAIDGFTSSDNETMAGKFVDGIGGGISKLISNIVGFPLNLLKSGIAWIGEMFGLDMSGLKNLDFVQIVKDMIMYPFDLLSDAVDWMKTLFTDPTAALDQLWTSIVDGSLIDLLFKPINMAINWVMGIFGWSTEDGEEFSLGTFVTDAFKSAWNWITGIFSWGADAAVEGGFTLMGWLTDAIMAPIRFIKNLFTFSDEDMNAKGIFTKLIDLVYLPLNLAINWVRGLFGWDTDEDGNKTEFSLGTLVTDAISKIWDWFKGLLDIDIKGIVSKIPGASTLMSWFSGDDEPEPSADPRESLNDQRMLNDMEMEEISQRMDKFESGRNAYRGRDTQEKYDADKARFDLLMAQQQELESRLARMSPDGNPVLEPLTDGQRAGQMYDAQGRLIDAQAGANGNTVIIKGGDTVNQGGGGGTSFVPVSTTDSDSQQWNGTND